MILSCFDFPFEDTPHVSIIAIYYTCAASFPFSFFITSLFPRIGSTFLFFSLATSLFPFPSGYVLYFLWDNGICAAPDFVCRYIAAPQPKHKERLDAVTGRYSVGRFPDSGRPCTLHLVLGPSLLLGLGFCICGYGSSGLVLATG